MKKIAFFAMLAALLLFAGCEDDFWKFMNWNENTEEGEYFRIEQSDLQDWDFGIVSSTNNVVLVKENDESDNLSHVLALLHNSGDTISVTFKNDSVVGFQYNSYYFTVTQTDTMLVLTTIEDGAAVSYSVPYQRNNSKSNLSVLIATFPVIVKGIGDIVFRFGSHYSLLSDLENREREALMKDLTEMTAEAIAGYAFKGVGEGAVFGYESYKLYFWKLRRGALRFHLGNASCTIESVSKNNSSNTIDVVVKITNGESIPNTYTWKNFWGETITSPNIVHYGVLCRRGYDAPTIYKYDDGFVRELETHASITDVFHFRPLDAERIMFRPYLAFRYEYEGTAIQHNNHSEYLALYGDVVPYEPSGDELFTVSAYGDQVRFAPGNLDYNGGYFFTAHQYDYGGYFGWGTGSNPTNTSTNWRDYPTFDDWGNHIAGGWRTLTRDEWNYVIWDRADASAKCGSATVCGVHGMVLLPDSWSGGTFTAGFNGWGTNVYDASSWSAMEDAGAVFLPAAGERGGTGMWTVGSGGYYWLSTFSLSFLLVGEDHACVMGFHDNGVFGLVVSPRCDGLSVRLVQDY